MTKGSNKYRIGVDMASGPDVTCIRIMDGGTEIISTFSDGQLYIMGVKAGDYPKVYEVTEAYVKSYEERYNVENKPVEGVRTLDIGEGTSV